MEKVQRACNAIYRLSFHAQNFMRVGYTSHNKANMLTKRQLKSKAPVHARPSLWFGSNQRDLI